MDRFAKSFDRNVANESEAVGKQRLRFIDPALFSRALVALGTRAIRALADRRFESAGIDPDYFGFVYDGDDGTGRCR